VRQEKEIFTPRNRYFIMASKGEERNNPMTGFLSHSWAINTAGKLLIRDMKHNATSDPTKINLTIWDCFVEVGYKLKFQANRGASIFPSVLLFKGREKGKWMALDPSLASKDSGTFGPSVRFHKKWNICLWVKAGRARVAKSAAGLICVALFCSYVASYVVMGCSLFFLGIRILD
jgi:hypothetical protein